jgi:hypothetical protein
MTSDNIEELKYDCKYNKINCIMNKVTNEFYYNSYVNKDMENILKNYLKQKNITIYINKIYSQKKYMDIPLNELLSNMNNYEFWLNKSNNSNNIFILTKELIPYLQNNIEMRNKNIERIKDPQTSLQKHLQHYPNINHEYDDVLKIINEYRESIGIKFTNMEYDKIINNDHRCSICDYRLVNKKHKICFTCFDYNRSYATVPDEIYTLSFELYGLYLNTPCCCMICDK